MRPRRRAVKKAPVRDMVPGFWYGATMLNESDRTAIVELAATYGVRRVILFGSASDPARHGRDIDLGVEGVPPDRYYEFCGKLMMRVSQPVDVVDLGPDTIFNRLVRRDGVAIYG